MTQVDFALPPHLAPATMVNSEGTALSVSRQSAQTMAHRLKEMANNCEQKMLVKEAVKAAHAEEMRWIEYYKSFAVRRKVKMPAIVVTPNTGAPRRKGVGRRVRPLPPAPVRPWLRA